MTELFLERFLKCPNAIYNRDLIHHDVENHWRYLYVIVSAAVVFTFMHDASSLPRVQCEYAW